MAWEQREWWMKFSLPNNSLLRSVCIDDLADILVWRNSDRVRLQMINQHRISMAEHLDWFEKNSNNPNKIILLWEYNNTKYGFVQFYLHDRNSEIEWGFYTSPETPKGLGLIFGKDVISYVFSQYKINVIIGKVLEKNVISNKFHLRLGFKEMNFIETIGNKKLKVFSLSRSLWLRQEK